MAHVRKKVRADGSEGWRVWWRDEDGKQRTQGFDSQEAAEAHAKSVDEQAGVRKMFKKYWTEHPENDLFPAQEERWKVTTYARAMVENDQDIATTTRALYLRQIRLHLDDTPLGGMDVRKVMPRDCEQWWRNLTDKRTGEKAGAGVRRQAQQLLARIFNRAVAVGDIGVSPLKRAPEIKRPRRKMREPEVERLTVEQVRELADAAAARGETRERDRLIVLVMAFGGLRAGEVGGLKRGDIERPGDRCRLRVRRQVVRETREAPYAKEPKTEAGKRAVPIPCSVADALEKYAKEHGGGYIFTARSGRLLSQTDIRSIVTKAGASIGLEVSSHTLRRTFASLAVESGANVKALQGMLGHATIQQTLDTYAHLFRDREAEKIAERMEELWNGE